MCQCPVSGLLHFYGGYPDSLAGTDIRVNALYRAYSISTAQDTVEGTEETCVNALYRAYSISTATKLYKSISDDVCQCPVSGLLHFYK